MPCTVDHLVVAAASLDAGCTFVADLLGELPLPGGVHPQLGTHNAVLSLGGSVYLEVIAIDPDGKTPAFPRWFSLDSDQTRADLEVSPRLLTWVVRTPAIASLTQLDAYAGCKVRPMSRAHLAVPCRRFVAPCDSVAGVCTPGGRAATGELPVQWPTRRVFGCSPDQPGVTADGSR